MPARLAASGTVPGTAATRGRGSVLALLLAAFLAVIVPALPVAGQGVSLDGSGEGEPIEVTAENGIEWHRDSEIYIARGNAAATRGTLTLYGDVLTAHYRNAEGGGSEIWKIEALGNVRVRSPGETAYGNAGVFDVDHQIAVLTGGDLRLITETDTVTARDSLEYWVERGLAVARGNGVAQREDKELQGDTLAAYFTEERPGTRRLKTVEAFGNVQVSSSKDVATGDRGAYDVETGLARLYDNVTIVRGENRLRGDYGEVNLNTGVSRLLAAPPANGRKGGDGGVKGVFTPKQDKTPDQDKIPGQKNSGQQ